MKQKNYVYMIKHQYKNKKKRDVLLKYGFVPYQADGEEELIFAKQIVLDTNSSIFQYIKKAFEKIYEKATPEEREEDFKDYKFRTRKEKGKTRYTLILNKNIKKEFSECQLCFADSGIGAWTLFINAPDHVEYYNKEVLDECCKEEVDMLLRNKIIYEKRNSDRR